MRNDFPGEFETTSTARSLLANCVAHPVRNEASDNDKRVIAKNFMFLSPWFNPGQGGNIDRESFFVKSYLPRGVAEIA